MLVVISDFHLSDGTTGTAIDAGAFKIFRDSLRDMAYDASWRSDGKYRPLEVIDLVLMGDIFDLLRTRQWLEPGEVRPWSNQSDAGFARAVDVITQRIIRTNRESVEVLRELDVDSCVTIPPATADGRVQNVAWEPLHPDRHRVRVRRHYMVGNHDWPFHLQGPDFDSIRRAVVQALGLTNPAEAPFPYAIAESSELTRLCALHNVFLRHGDMYDADNFDGDRDCPSLGDAVVVELVVRFPKEVGNLLGEHSECAVELKEADNVRPLQMSPVWIASVVARTCRKPEEAAAVKRLWNSLISEFFRLPFVKQHRSPRHWSTLLSFWLSRLLPLQLCSRILRSWPFDAISASGHPSYKDAMTEQAVTPGKPIVVVYGHTHVYQLIPLDSSGPASHPVDQIYINSGTWRPYHQMVARRRRTPWFVRYHLMTFMAFYRDGERRGRHYETWNAALDSDNDPAKQP